MKGIKVLGFVFFSMWSMGSAQTIVTTDSSSYPTANVVINSGTPPTDVANTFNVGWKGDLVTPDFRNVGQTFTATSSFTMDSITFWVNTVGTSTSGAAFSMSLYTYSNASDLTPDSTVWNYSGTILSTLRTDFNANNAASTRTYLTFDVPDTLLSSGTVYGLVLYFTNPAGTSAQNMNFFQLKGADYSGGTFAYTTTGTAGNPSSSTSWSTSGDLFFWVQAVAIPEPSIKDTILGGVALLLGLRLIRLRKSKKISSRRA